MADETDLIALAAQTQMIYNRHCARFDAERSKSLFERTWLARFCALLPAQGSILDVGCGAGQPIAQYFVKEGYCVTGVDFSEEMIALAQSRFPDHQWVISDMRTLTLDQQFDGLIGWHSFFHLTQSEQRATIPLLARHLKPKGAFMITVGPKSGEVTGRVAGEKVYHSSLSPAEYRQLLAQCGCDIIDFVFEDPGCGHASILLAQKR